MPCQATKHPVLFEINTRAWLRDVSEASGTTATLADVPEAELDRFSSLGIDLVWLMGVWKVGEKAAEKARAQPGLEAEYRRALPDLRPEDITGSPYAVGDYTVAESLGGAGSLHLFRKRLEGRGIGLVLDFVTNHVGLDHAWIRKRPELFVQGDEGDLEREGGNYFRVDTVSGPRILAHGRDPYFPAWTDTAQLNFSRRETRAAMKGTLQALGGLCDGVRCDMAMLALDSVFRRVWGERALRTAGDPPASGEFWSEAIHDARANRPSFVFLAEAYWGLERELQILGFDYTYDKTLYDLLVRRDPAGIRSHLAAPLEIQARAARFVENHDEPRAAAVFPPERLRASTLIAATLPGMVLFHEGQLEGRKVRLPIQLQRRPPEPVDPPARAFHARLLEALKDEAFREGSWRLLEVRPAWEGNPTWRDFIAHEWTSPRGARMLVAANLGATRGQCTVGFGRAEWLGGEVELVDLLGDARYLRDGRELAQRGLYLDMPEAGCHLFQVSARPRR